MLKGLRNLFNKSTKTHTQKKKLFPNLEKTGIKKTVKLFYGLIIRFARKD